MEYSDRDKRAILDFIWTQTKNGVISNSALAKKLADLIADPDDFGEKMMGVKEPENADEAEIIRIKDEIETEWAVDTLPDLGKLPGRRPQSISPEDIIFPEYNAQAAESAIWDMMGRKRWNTDNNPSYKYKASQYELAMMAATFTAKGVFMKGLELSAMRRFLLSLADGGNWGKDSRGTAFNKAYNKIIIDIGTYRSKEKERAEKMFNAFKRRYDNILKRINKQS